MPPQRTAADRTALRAVAAGVVLWLVTGVTVLLLRDAGPDAGILVGYLLFLFWLYPAGMAHLVLLGYALWRALRGGARPIAIVYPYLVVSLALYGFVAVQFGAGELLGDALTAAKRGVLESGQVTLEATLRERPDDVEAVRAALRAGADPNVPVPPMGMSPLHVAANRGAVETVRVLIAAGGDTNARSPIAWSSMRIEIPVPRPLDLAALVRDPERRRATIEALLEAGADPRRSTLLTIACRQGDLPLYERARALRAPDVADGDGLTCLHQAARGGHAEVFRAHRPVSVDVDTSAGTAGTPLDLALRHEHWTIARDLLERGASATKTRWARDALRQPAAGDEDLVVVQRLIAERWPGIDER